MSWKPYTTGIEILSPRAGLAIGHGANFTSQFGEDGLVKALLEKFCAANRWCFEVGAADGEFLSNTARLREQGWKTVLIEGDAEQYEQLRNLASETVFTVPKRIDQYAIDKILTKCGAPLDIDFGVIDVDGFDYWIWEGLLEHRPRLMLVEFAYQSENEADLVPYDSSVTQATYKAILRLGNQKGYVAAAKTICNILFYDANLE